jgi:hypothetical protein
LLWKSKQTKTKVIIIEIKSRRISELEIRSTECTRRIRENEQSLRALCNTTEHSSIHRITVKGVEKEKGTERDTVFEEIMTKPSNLMKNMNLHI